MSSKNRSKAHGNNLEQRKSFAGNYGNGGDKRPPKKVMEKSHTISESSKRKIESAKKEIKRFKSLKLIPNIWKLML
jgi:hypothetical protein